MVRMISGINGSPMWVHETRVEEYLARGHKLAPAPEPPKPGKKPRSRPKANTEG